ncbi:glycine--tRNA ligase subunit beta [Eoetvoesiella caeni]|uniref:Glycine--tRNA ligase beta subunit n=1 Tax=Eoetvoesiella caeni TaxID=645616 RepID=A0A366HAY4_9BURK|nr:glycine--tRNA ligase subunit beta [Eoetvoesiella caeni]MCI2809513.1 glycine--tRNA ligase subunit beta [Eoetvoesiella caeni]NYT56009.1 glycine--tRNA ligase subunit beta [Eoetvoesiella caeni]RBP38772.1 glycyl-tRNA synthetase beta chain [Eoetvoesiella caeni]
MTAASSFETRPLLVELLTEELPPKALNKLGLAFAEGIRSVLDKQNLLGGACVTSDFATPRRLAVHLSHVLAQAPEQAYTEKLMPASVGLTPEGKATPALVKKLASKNLEHLGPDDLVHESDGKQDYLYAKGTAPGRSLADAIQEALEHAIVSLPIPKVMRYQLADGVSSVKFVRPAHRLIVLWGGNIIKAHALGLEAGNESAGHRFMAPAAISIKHADTYARQLLDEGKVIVSFNERRQAIAGQLQDHAQRLNATLGTDPAVEALLDEVTALVEHPTVYVGQFDQGFLSVPPECLILTMRLNQKYFPLFEPGTGQLTHRFLIVSNMQVADPSNIVQGNERVVRPRLADAQFFFEQDRKTPLAARVDSLANSVYHNKLGSQLERVERVRQIARYLAAKLDADGDLADRAALLAKADLNSNMVAEFPELQGIMGAYYARADGEPEEVVRALGDQYRIRIDEPVTPDTITSTILFIAERVETLVGIWGIGLVPTGERDPFGLRRAALGIISAFEQLSAGGYLATPNAAGLHVRPLLEEAFRLYAAHPLNAGTVPEVLGFIYERYRNQLGSGYDRNVVDAVLSQQPPLHEVLFRIQACASFAERTESASLAAANKRIANLLKKAEGAPGKVDAGKLSEPAEQALAKVIATLKPQADAQFELGNFTDSLAIMAQAKEAVDAFFADIMVMAEDPAVRANRLALLDELHGAMNRVADISRLAQ